MTATKFTEGERVRRIDGDAEGLTVVCATPDAGGRIALLNASGYLIVAPEASFEPSPTLAEAVVALAEAWVESGLASHKPRQGSLPGPLDIAIEEVGEKLTALLKAKMVHEIEVSQRQVG